jgi:hypothetical protein
MRGYSNGNVAADNETASSRNSDGLAPAVSQIATEQSRAAFRMPGRVRRTRLKVVDRDDRVMRAVNWNRGRRRLDGLHALASVSKCRKVFRPGSQKQSWGPRDANSVRQIKRFLAGDVPAVSEYRRYRRIPKSLSTMEGFSYVKDEDKAHPHRLVSTALQTAELSCFQCVRCASEGWKRMRNIKKREEGRLEEGGFPTCRLAVRLADYEELAIVFWPVNDPTQALAVLSWE